MVAIVGQEPVGDKVKLTVAVEGRAFEFMLMSASQRPRMEEALGRLGVEYILEAEANGERATLIGRQECHDNGVKWPAPDTGSTWRLTRAS